MHRYEFARIFPVKTYKYYSQLQLQHYTVLYSVTTCNYYSPGSLPVGIIVVISGILRVVYIQSANSGCHADLEHANRATTRSAGRRYIRHGQGIANNKRSLVNGNTQISQKRALTYTISSSCQKHSDSPSFFQLPEALLRIYPGIAYSISSSASTASLHTCIHFIDLRWMHVVTSISACPVMRK